jgi:hypothetical protein
LAGSFAATRIAAETSAQEVKAVLFYLLANTLFEADFQTRVNTGNALQALLEAHRSSLFGDADQLGTLAEMNVGALSNGG